MSDKIIAYKGMDENMCCRGKQYEIGKTYTEDKALVEHARQLKAEGKEACSLLYKPDLAWNPVRYACVLEQLRRQFKKFKTYYPKKN